MHFDLSYCPDNPCSYTGRLGAFRYDTIDGVRYYLNFDRQGRARVTVNLSLYISVIRAYGYFLTLTIDYVTAARVLLQNRHY
jgi:hypothetical protein